MARPSNKLTKRDVDNAKTAGWGTARVCGCAPTTADGASAGSSSTPATARPPNSGWAARAGDNGVTLTERARRARSTCRRSRTTRPHGGEAQGGRGHKNRRTFAEAAEAVIAARRKTQWRTSATGRKSSLADWTRTLQGDCASFAKRYVDEIDVNDVKATVARFWDAGQYGSFRRALKRVELVLEYALAHGWRTADNPATWRRMQHIFPAPKQNGGASHAAVDWREMPAFMANLRAKETITSLALEMIVLTAARSGEVLDMTWREVDLSAATWTVPGSRMKAGREHVVPLSSAAMTLSRSSRRSRTRARASSFPARTRTRRSTTKASGRGRRGSPKA